MDEVKEMCQVLLMLGVDDMDMEDRVELLIALGFRQEFQSTYMTHVFGDPYGDAIRFDKFNSIGEIWDVCGNNKGWCRTLQRAYNCRWSIALR